MKLLLLCLGLTLVCAHDEDNHDVVTSNIDISKISGRWNSILLASDVKETIEENGSFRLFMDYFQALHNSSLFMQKGFTHCFFITNHQTGCFVFHKPVMVYLECRRHKLFGCDSKVLLLCLDYN